MIGIALNEIKYHNLNSITKIPLQFPMEFLLSKNTHKCKDCILNHFRCPICIAPKGSFLALNTVSSLNINYICNALNCTFTYYILIRNILDIECQ